MKSKLLSAASSVLLLSSGVSAATIDTSALNHLEVVNELPGWSFEVNSLGTENKMTFIDTFREIPGDPDLMAMVGEAFIIQDGRKVGDEAKGGTITLKFDREFSRLSSSLIDVEEVSTVSILDADGLVLFTESFQTDDGEVSGFEWHGEGGKSFRVTLGGSGAFTVPDFDPVPEPSTILLTSLFLFVFSNRTRKGTIQW